MAYYSNGLWYNSNGTVKNTSSQKVNSDGTVTVKTGNSGTVTTNKSTGVPSSTKNSDGTTSGVKTTAGKNTTIASATTPTNSVNQAVVAGRTTAGTSGSTTTDNGYVIPSSSSSSSNESTATTKTVTPTGNTYTDAAGNVWDSTTGLLVQGASSKSTNTTPVGSVNQAVVAGRATPNSTGTITYNGYTIPTTNGANDTSATDGGGSETTPVTTTQQNNALANTLIKTLTENASGTGGNQSGVASTQLQDAIDSLYSAIADNKTSAAQYVADLQNARNSDVGYLQSLINNAWGLKSRLAARRNMLGSLDSDANRGYKNIANVKAENQAISDLVDQSTLNTANTYTPLIAAAYGKKNDASEKGVDAMGTLVNALGNIEAYNQYGAQAAATDAAANIAIANTNAANNNTAVQNQASGLSQLTALNNSSTVPTKAQVIAAYALVAPNASDDQLDSWAEEFINSWRTQHYSKTNTNTNTNNTNNKNTETSTQGNSVVGSE